MGGIGKTTLAYAYVNDETYTKHYNHIAWVTVIDNIKDDLTNQLSNDDTGFTYNPNEDVDANLKHLCDVMRHLDGDNLLVIDNANDSEDILNNKNTIETFGWKVLFTSRAKPAGTTIIPVEELDSDDAKELFCRFYKREIDNELLTKLLARIEYHTLLTELLAKAANKNRRLDIAALYSMVESEGIKAPRLDGKIPIGKHADQRDIEKEQKLYNYILAIFDLGDLSEDEKEYLRYFSVLPSTAIEANGLFDFFKIKDDNETTFYDVLDELVKKGWLQEIENSYKIHPLIQTVGREKLKPDAKNCFILIDSFICKLLVEPGENPLDRIDLIPYAENILSFIYEDDEEVAKLANNFANILQHFGNYEKALKYGLKALVIRENVLDKDHPDLATSYNNISQTYQASEDLEKALENVLKAITIREKVLDKNHPDLATSYFCIASTYYYLKDYSQAKCSIDKAVDIYQRVLPAEHPDLKNALGWQEGINRELSEADI